MIVPVVRRVLESEPSQLMGGETRFSRFPIRCHMPCHNNSKNVDHGSGIIGQPFSLAALKCWPPSLRVIFSMAFKTLVYPGGRILAQSLKCGFQLGTSMRNAGDCASSAKMDSGRKFFQWRSIHLPTQIRFAISNPKSLLNKLFWNCSVVGWAL